MRSLRERGPGQSAHQALEALWRGLRAQNGGWVIDHPEEGVPQGGCISPLLSNLYLHEVLDLWFEREVKPRMRGRAFMVRFADDAVLGFEREDDARRVLQRLRLEIQGRWRKWLSRRSRAAQLNWIQFNRLLQHHPLQPARVVHSVSAT